MKEDTVKPDPQIDISNMRWRVFAVIFFVSAIALGSQGMMGQTATDGSVAKETVSYWASILYFCLGAIQVYLKRVAPLLERVAMLGAAVALLIQLARFLEEAYAGPLLMVRMTEIIPWMAVVYTVLFITYPARMAAFLSSGLLIIIVGWWTFYVLTANIPGEIHPGLQSLMDTATAGVVLLLMLFVLKRMTEAGASAQARADAMTELAHKDSLTGLYNRRYLDRRLAEEFIRARRYQRDLSVAMCDIDNFKQINDTMSHATGDATLVKISELLDEHSREVDTVARFGGEEFVVLFSETPLDQAGIASEKIRASIETWDWSSIHPDLRVTISIGLAGGVHHENHEKLLGEADRKLYQAKRTGKNRICA